MTTEQGIQLAELLSTRTDAINAFLDHADACKDEENSGEVRTDKCKPGKERWQASEDCAEGKALERTLADAVAAYEGFKQAIGMTV